MSINANEITSIRSLHNSDGSVALSICTKSQIHPVFVTISTAEFEMAGGTEGLNEDKQLAVDFLIKYRAGRP